MNRQIAIGAIQFRLVVAGLASRPDFRLSGTTRQARSIEELKGPDMQRESSPRGSASRWLRHRCSCWRPAPQRTLAPDEPRRSWDPSPAPSDRHNPRTSFPRRGVPAASPRQVGAAIRGKARSTSYRHSPADWPACTLPTEVEGLRSCGSSVPGESPRSPAGNGPRTARPEAAEISAAPAPRHPDRPAKANSAPRLSAARDSAGLCSCLPCRSRRSAAGRGGIRSGDAGLRVSVAWVISFLATCSPLISGKHPPGITNDARSCPDPLSPFRCMWAAITFDVGHGYAASGPPFHSMWATITPCGPRLR